MKVYIKLSYKKNVYISDIMTLSEHEYIQLDNIVGKALEGKSSYFNLINSFKRLFISSILFLIYYKIKISNLFQIFVNYDTSYN